MTTLNDILDKFQDAIEQKNREAVFQVIDELDVFCGAAFAPPQTTLDWPDAQHAVAIIIEMGNINEELSQIQSILKANQQDAYLSRFSLALQLLRAKMAGTKAWDLMNNQAMAVHFMANDIRHKLKPYGKIDDLSFLANMNEPGKVHPQTLFGKKPKSGSFLFPEKYIWMMLPSYWQNDIDSVPYFTPIEKKLMKVKRHADGLLNRVMDSGNVLSDGSYLYVVSPKGGLYMCNDDARDTQVLKQACINIEGLRHSSFRAGQPVLCAGSIKIEEGEITEIDTGSGHYGVPNANLLMACLHLHRKGIIKNTCEIKSYGGLETITVEDLLHHPMYEPLRMEYEQLVSAEVQKSKAVALVAQKSLPKAEATEKVDDVAKKQKENATAETPEVTAEFIAEAQKVKTTEWKKEGRNSRKLSPREKLAPALEKEALPSGDLILQFALQHRHACRAIIIGLSIATVVLMAMASAGLGAGIVLAGAAGAGLFSGCVTFFASRAISTSNDLPVALPECATP